MDSEKRPSLALLQSIQKLLPDWPESLPIHGVSTDSRNIRPGELFVGIEGENFDGNQFAHQALEKGACAAVISRKNQSPPQKNCFYVEDSLDFLRTLAKEYRQKLEINLFAVVGSNGKTTTKDLLGYLLKEIEGGEHVFKTERSLNSILGLALSLLQIRDENFAVIEIGIDAPGWMKKHLDLVQPQSGLITTIQEEHLEKLKNIETVAQEELQLLYFLKNREGSFAANLDSQWIAEKEEYFPPQHLTYSLSQRADIEATYLKPQKLHAFGVQWDLPLPGEHNAQNFLAALTALRLLKPDIPYDELKSLSEKIHQFTPSAHRSQWQAIGHSRFVFDDCYNANPQSMERSIQCFQDLATGLEKTLVLGDMLDLGEESEKAHQRLINLVQVMDFDYIYLLGENFSSALQKQPRKPTHITSFLTLKDLETQIKSHTKEEEAFMVKGSRSMKLERIVEVIKDL